MPAVVNIATTQKMQPQRRAPFPMPGPFGDDPFDEFFRRFFGDPPLLRQQQSLGSGFLMSADGDIVTHHHVVAGAGQMAVFRGGVEKLTIVTLGELTDQRVGAHVTKTVETAGG